MKKGRLLGCLLGVLVLLVPWSPAQARQLTGRSFGAEGWNQAGGEDIPPIPVDFTGVSRGSLSFALRRTGTPAPKEWETLFELVSSDGFRVLRVKVNWSLGKDSSHFALFFQGGHRVAGEYYWRGMGLWGPYVVLDRRVAAGELIRVDLTWDDLSGNCKVYVDGRETGDSYGWLDAAKGKWHPDKRKKANGELRKRGKRPRYDSLPMSHFLLQAAFLDFGHNNPIRPLSRKWEGSALKSAVIDDFTVYVDEIPEPGTAPPPAAGTEAVIDSVLHDADRTAGFSGRLVTGDMVTVTLNGSPGGEASFDVARLTNLFGEIALDWRGWGIYPEEKIFFDEGEVNLRDVDGYRVYAGTLPPGEITGETEYLEELEVEEQALLIDGLEPGIPYYVTVMAVMDDGTYLPVIDPRSDLSMEEVEGSPGTYEGTFTVGYADGIPDAVIVGRLVSGETEEVLAGDEAFEIDPALRIEVLATPDELKADEKSTAEVKVIVTDANEEPVSDREISFVLATTSQYTGVVGGGAFTDEVGGEISRDFRGVTNLFGELEVEYTAGFAAKTAIIVARDVESNDTGAGYVKTYINAAAELELEAVQEVAGKALGYSIVVTSSDEWLTADGESEARITALVTRDGIPVEGHRVGFSVTSGAGTIRTVRGDTDDRGQARAVYTAGRKIGMVLITATDHTVGITGSVQIELRSDAPAKIGVVVIPDLLPADGRSRADVLVVVTDINDNPNEGVEVEYRVAIGSGRLRDIDGETDSDGESTAEYVAGRIPGKVSIEVTVRSTAPTAEELAAARNLALSVTDYDFY